MNVVISKRRGGDSRRRKFIDIKTNNNNVRCQLDSGSDLSIISKNTCKKTGEPKLTSTEKVARGLSSKKLQF